MAPSISSPSFSNRKPPPSSTPATVAFAPLKNSLLNLPASLVNILVSQNKSAQNVVVEVASRGAGSAQSRSAYAGWTGMQSKRRPTAGMQSQRIGDDAVVEMDPALGKNIGLIEGAKASLALMNCKNSMLIVCLKVSLQLHVDPPAAHTLHIEPLTASDWEIIELHASFLELNLLSQIRCVTTIHPLSVYLSPTSTASIRLTRVEPESALSSTNGFAKVSPDAEIIVAPKTRQRRQSRDAKSATSTIRTTGRKKIDTSLSASGKTVMFFRGIVLPCRVDMAQSEQDEDELEEELLTGGRGFTIYLDPSTVTSRQLRGVSRVLVSVVRPQSLDPLKDTQQQEHRADDNDKQTEEVEAVTKLVALVKTWNFAPDSKHVALSRLLSANLLLFEGEVGHVIRIEPAPAQVPHKLFMKVKIHPFSKQDKEAEGVKWGGGTKRLEEMAINRLYDVLGPKRQRNGTKAMIEEDLASLSLGEGILEGPLTDGMALPPIEDSPISAGGLIKLEVTPNETGDASQSASLRWYMMADKKPAIEVSAPVPRVSAPAVPETLFVPDEKEVVGVDNILIGITENILSASSVLINGAHGSGKSSILRLVAKRISGAPHYYKIIDPGSLSKFSEERIASIKENLNRWFSEATWMAGKTSRSVLLMDDLDRLCGAESENQDNSRARQLSEIVVAIIKKFTTNKSVIILGSCQAKESLHTHLIASHVFRETIPLNAMTKEGRRIVLQGIAETRGVIDPRLDMREIAARTEGYMPGDLALLVDRARHEAVVRMVETSASLSDSPLSLRPIDFDSALAGFVPAGLRGVKLQTSGAAWKDIGGLMETRKILLETLEWPTRYAPIFASCPLRLRSGLLLYGYPGCGKTLLASAVAGECGLNFISVKGPEILNKYIGASEKSVRDLFERAQGAKPCVLFFDEFDSIAPKRGHDSTGVTDRVVNQMLTQMDGAEGLDGVYVLAATSRPDLIDPALLRPGRLDKSLLCDLPSLDERLDIIYAVSRKVHFAPEVDLSEIAKRTSGYSGADLQAVVYNSYLEAVQSVIAEEIRQKEALGTVTTKSDLEQFEFLEFVLGDNMGTKGTKDVTNAGAKKRIQLLEKISTLRKLSSSKKQSSKPQTDLENKAKQKQVIITWGHVEISLKTTRPSISAQEQSRLKRIYEEFIGARNGEMPSGQGSTEVGGRSSLM